MKVVSVKDHTLLELPVDLNYLKPIVRELTDSFVSAIKVLYHSFLHSFFITVDFSFLLIITVLSFFPFLHHSFSWILLLFSLSSFHRIFLFFITLTMNFPSIHITIIPTASIPFPPLKCLGERFGQRYVIIRAHFLFSVLAIVLVGCLEGPPGQPHPVSGAGGFFFIVAGVMFDAC